MKLVETGMPDIPSIFQNTVKRIPRPVHDWILVQRFTEEEMAGRIILPESSSSPDFVAKVFAVGPGRLTDQGVRLPMSCKPGDIIKFTGQVLGWMVDGVGYFCVPDTAVTAIIEPIANKTAS
jgi:chaperonin GroES